MVNVDRVAVGEGVGELPVRDSYGAVFSDDLGSAAGDAGQREGVRARAAPFTVLPANT